MLHSLILDMGNVLLRYDPEHFLDRLDIRDPQDRALLLREIFYSPIWPKLDSGELTEADLERHSLARPVSCPIARPRALASICSQTPASASRNTGPGSPAAACSTARWSRPSAAV